MKKTFLLTSMLFTQLTYCSEETKKCIQTKDEEKKASENQAAINSWCFFINRAKNRTLVIEDMTRYLDDDTHVQISNDKKLISDNRVFEIRLFNKTYKISVEKYAFKNGGIGLVSKELGTLDDQGYLNYLVPDHNHNVISKKCFVVGKEIELLFDQAGSSKLAVNGKILD